MTRQLQLPAASRQPSAFPRRKQAGWVAILLAWVLFAQLALGARHLSMTSDEAPHLASGYASLAAGETWQVAIHGHPPLINAWSAWPLLLQPERPAPREVPYWGKDFNPFVRSLCPLLGPIQRLTFVTRVPIMLLAIVLMALVYRWASDKFGPWAGGLAAAVMVWDPNLVAHAQLDTTDLGLALFAFACLYLLERLLRLFSWRLVIGVGVLLGAALASKATGMLLAPVVVALLGWEGVYQAVCLWRSRRPAPGWPRLLAAGGCWLAAAAVTAALAVLVVWGTYGFKWDAVPGTSRALPLASHLRLLTHTLADKDRLAFLWGEVRQGGWWWYFPAAFAVKTPLPLIAALGAAALAAARQARREVWAERALWLFPLLYVVIAIQSRMNIGYRHLLPVFPFAYVGIARLARYLSAAWASRWRPAVRGLAAALGAWYVVGTLAIYPYAITYFNELAGGPDNGYRFLVDSNLDWGQSLLALKAYVDQHAIDRLAISQFTNTDPAWYGIAYESLAPMRGAPPVMPSRFNPPPGWYAISATTLQGVPLADSEQFDWFRKRQPEAQVGHALFVYHVPELDLRPAWVAQCTQPVAPLDNAEIAAGFGDGPWRVAYFDCTHSWLFPPGSGWYVLSPQAQLPPSALPDMPLVYQQKRTGRLPPFDIYFSPAGDAWRDGALERQALAAPGEWLPEQAQRDGQALAAPVVLDGPLAFEGYAVSASAVSPGQSIELITYWRVTASPGRLLSLMAHVLDAGGRPVAVGDGLGVPLDIWQAGDVIAQRHVLAVPDGTPPGTYWLQTGVYWLDNLERQPVLQAGQVLGDRLVLARLEVYNQ